MKSSFAIKTTSIVLLLVTSVTESNGCQTITHAVSASEIERTPLLNGQFFPFPARSFLYSGNNTSLHCRKFNIMKSKKEKTKSLMTQKG